MRNRPRRGSRQASEVQGSKAEVVCCLVGQRYDVVLQVSQWEEPRIARAKSRREVSRYSRCVELVNRGDEQISRKNRKGDQEKSKSRIPSAAVIPIEKPSGRLVRSKIRVKCSEIRQKRVEEGPNERDRPRPGSVKCQIERNKNNSLD